MLAIGKGRGGGGGTMIGYLRLPKHFHFYQHSVLVGCPISQTPCLPRDITPTRFAHHPTAPSHTSHTPTAKEGLLLRAGRSAFGTATDKCVTPAFCSAEMDTLS